MSQVHQPRSAPTKQEDGLTGFIAAVFFNNGLIGLIGLLLLHFLTTDLTDSCCHFFNNGFNGYYFQGVHLSQVHQPRSAPTKQEDGLTGFIAAVFFNNGLIGLIGFLLPLF